MALRRALLRRIEPAMRGVRAGVTALAAVAALAPAALACPYCSLSQGVDTLLYISGFLVIPYLVVSGVWFWMKRVLASEHEGRS